MKKSLIFYVFFIILSCFFFITPDLNAQSVPGRAIEFYGSDQSGKAGIIKLQRLSTAANIGSGPFTIEWLMKTIPEKNTADPCVTQSNDWTKGNIILDASASDPQDFGGFGVSIEGGVITFGVQTATESYTICGNTQINDGTWHHIAVTRIATTGLMSIFVDGNLDFQFFGPSGNISYNSSRTAPAEDDSYMILGAKKADPNKQYLALGGVLDEFRISTTKRYSYSYAPPTAKFISDDSTALLYHFDDCSVTDISDSSPNSINAKILPIVNPASPLIINSTAPLSEGESSQTCAAPSITPPICDKKPTGDANCDSLVNLTDFEVWRKEYSGEENTLGADFGSNGKVDLTDFEIWRKGFIGEV